MTTVQKGDAIQKGDVVFFKRAKKSSGRKAKEILFKGHAFGVVLGEVPPFQADPPPEQLLRMMGTIGFLTFDDVAEFLGAEMAEKCVKLYEDKYYGKEAQDVAPVVNPMPDQEPVEEAKVLSLLDSTGTPINSVATDPNNETRN